ncbi:MAG: methionyl-tRNA formyltransferase [Ignavibacteriae bacterium]|nr:methionyl-tRNA formyltransferase [Ignavibacteriota bacterium]
MLENSMNIIFMGTPEFAVPSLQAIHQKFGVSAVVTVPDKPQGRGMKLTPSAVKIAALELGLPVLQPELLKSEQFRNEIEALNPDIIVVIAFRILPASIYTLATLGAFNIHGSLLPKFRGAAPINWAIINGEKESGVTSFLLNDKVDTGKILRKRTCQITETMTAGELYSELMPLAAELAVETCILLSEGNAVPIPQDDTIATPAPKLFRENCSIDWTKSARDVKNFVRGVNPSPIAWVMWDDKRLKVYTVEVENKTLPTGAWKIENGKFIVGCGDGNSVSLLEIQQEGKPKMSVDIFLRGYRGVSEGFYSLN